MFPDSMLLGDAREWLRNKLDKGAPCPCCGQRAQQYRRKLNSGMARSLIAMYAIDAHGWIHVPTQIGARSREEGKLAYWGLVEESAAPRDDGGRAGWWRLTDRGRRFVLKQLTVPSYALVYNNKVRGFDGPFVDISQTLGAKFSYDELMGR